MSETNTNYEDKNLTCVNCNNEFTFSAGEQAFYAEKGFTNEPKKCEPCRKEAKAARQASYENRTTF